MAWGRVPVGPGPLPGTQAVGGAGGVNPRALFPPPHHTRQGSFCPSVPQCSHLVHGYSHTSFLELCKSNDVQCGAGRAVARRLGFILGGSGKPCGEGG